MSDTVKSDREEHGMEPTENQLAWLNAPDANPWEDSGNQQARDDALEQQVRAQVAAERQEEADWRQRDLPAELRALGVERDVVGTVVQVVRVRMPGAPRDYTYQWWNTTMVVDDGEPLEQADWLRTGDWVKLPGNVVSPEGSKGRVTGYGRSGYTGPLKDVACRMETPDIWTVQMEAVRDKVSANRVYQAAKARGVQGEQLLALVETGRVRLEGLGRL